MPTDLSTQEQTQQASVAIEEANRRGVSVREFQEGEQRHVGVDGAWEEVCPLLMRAFVRWVNGGEGVEGWRVGYAPDIRGWLAHHEATGGTWFVARDHSERLATGELIAEMSVDDHRAPPISDLVNALRSAFDPGMVASFAESSDSGASS